MLPVNPYPGLAGKEIDLRKELNKMFTGSPSETPKGQIHILRRMRRAEGVDWVPTREEELVRCDCVSSPTEEPDITYPCSLCDGEGWLFDEEFVLTYLEERYEYIDTETRRPYGKAPVSLTFFYIEHYKDISRFDVLIEPQLDETGELISPVRIRRRHDIHMAQPFRSDEGRIEFWRVAVNSTPV